MTAAFFNTTTNTSLGKANDGFNTTITSLHTTNAGGETGSGGILSTAVAELAEMVLMCGVSNAVAVAGVLANVAILAVLVAQGVRDSINTCLFALALSDLAYEASVLAAAQCYYMAWDRHKANNIGQSLIPHLVMLKIAFARISNAVTAIISLERCACVLLPFKFKRLVTGKCTGVSILAVYVTIFALFVPVLLMFETQWFAAENNRTVAYAMPTQFYLDNFQVLTVFTDLVINVVLPLFTLTVVSVSTLLTVLTLRWSTKWRKSMNSFGNSEEKKNPSSATSTTSKRGVSAAEERTERLTKMLVVVACIYIVCVLPGASATVVRLFIPEFTLNRTYHNTFVVVYFVDFTMQTINAAINIVVYTVMSSRFRRSFWDLLTLRCRQPRQTGNFTGDSTAVTGMSATTRTTQD